jgi:hypothetical protein
MHRDPTIDHPASGQRSAVAEPTSSPGAFEQQKSGCDEELLWHAHAVTLPLKNHGLRVRGSFPA